MRLDLLLLAPIAVGHVALFVLTANVVHAFGHTERALVSVKLGFLAVFAAVSAALAWGAWQAPFLAWPWPGYVYGSGCLAMGLVIFPASTAYHHYQPRPPGIEQRAAELELGGESGTESLIGDGRHAWMLRLPGNEALRLRKMEWELTLPGLPAALDGLSILHLSDLHFAPDLDRRFFEEVLDAAASWESDLVLFTGDLVDHEESVDWIVPLLSRVRGKRGAYSILGNHDLGHGPERIRRLLGDAGFTDLEAGWASVEASGRTIALGGTSAPWGPALSLSDRPPADFRILLSHCPDLFYWAERSGFDLMLSGHNHGGQVRLPLVGAAFMPSKFSRRFDRGFFRKNGLTMHVSQGVSGKHPVRYGCVPEIGRLVLRAVVERRDSGRDAAKRVRAHAVTADNPT